MLLGRWLLLGVLATQATALQADLRPVPATVVWERGLLSIDADGVMFSDLLAGIAATTGVRVWGLDSLDGLRVSLRFAGLPLLDGLGRLLAGTNYAMVVNASATAGNDHIVVAVAGRKTVAESLSPRSAADLPAALADPGADAYQVLAKLAEQGDTRALRDSAEHGDPATRALAMQRLSRVDPAEALRVALVAAGRGEPAERVHALQVLGGLDRPEATQALGAALGDADMDVRHTALVSLTGQSSPAAVDLLVQTLGDEVPWIRLMALDLLARRGITAAALGPVLADRDPAVRLRAQALLDQVERRP